jgi:hypothetical protein
MSSGAGAAMMLLRNSGHPLRVIQGHAGAG